MSSQASISKPVPFSIYVSLLTIRGGHGLVLGLYLYITQVVFLDSLKGKLPDEQAVAWSTWIFAYVMFWLALAEYPTGVVSDVCGRKVGIILGLLVHGIFYLAYMIVFAASRFDASPYLILFLTGVAWTILGVGYGLLSGTATAWLNDALDEAGCHRRFAGVLACGDFAFWVNLLFGSLLALLLYNARLEYILFASGFVASLVFALLCVLVTEENRQFRFRSFRDLFGPARKEVWRKYRALWSEGKQIFWKDRRFLIVTLVGAAINTLRDVIDYSWISYCRASLGILNHEESLTSFGRMTWLALSLTLVALIGQFGVLWLIGRWERRGIEVVGARLVGLNVALNILYCLPLAALYFVIGYLVPPGSDAGFIAFLSLMAAYAFFQGASDSPRESLDNSYIPPGTQPRSAVLSYISYLRKMVSAAVVFALGFFTDSPVKMITAWVCLAAAVVVLSVLMPVLMRGNFALPEPAAVDEEPANEGNGAEASGEGNY